MTVATPPTERRANSDRRRELRHSLAGRISWKRTDDHDGHFGWLSDASRSSVSFITSSRSEPLIGEEIEVDGDHRGLMRRGRIARVTPYDDSLWLVACRAAEEQNATPPPLESLRRSAIARR